MEQALSGMRILDFGQYIAGPFAAMLLAEHGAEVIKIERPGGDPCRDRPGFMVWNRSKKGITLDLKKEEGRKIARDLAKHADILIENFRPGMADKLGIGYETIRQLNPRLVYCSISGFGRKGPYRDLPAWDPIVFSAAGIFVEQAGESNPPLYLVMPMPSYYAALVAAFSVTTALVARETTGQGQRVDVSLLNALAFAAGSGLIEFEGQMKIPFEDPQGAIPCYKFYQGSDGEWFFLGMGNFVFFTKFAMLMDRPEWLIDPLFEGAPFMILPPRSAEVIAMFKEIFATKTRDEWIELLRAEDIPCAPARPVEQFLDDPQVIANEMVVTLDQPGLGKVRQMGVPVKLRRTPGKVQDRSPLLGEHSEAILADILDYPARKITELKEGQII
ncbi:MAG: CoA transferase [Deltaproteobacteria bacterium]|nr:CoA transferase [Deltaproteobacteria bacterium]